MPTPIVKHVWMNPWAYGIIEAPHPECHLCTWSFHFRAGRVWRLKFINAMCFKHERFRRRS